MSSRIQRYSEHIAAEQKRFILTRMRHEPWYRRAFYTCLSFAQVIYDEVMENRLFVRASGAAYTTVLALVPFLVVGGSFVVMFNKQASLAEIITHINDWVVPVAGDTLATILADNLARTLDIGLGPVGAIFLVVTSVMLFIHIEDTLNFIWHVRKSRPLHLRVLLFYAVVTLGPLLVSYSIYQAAQFFDDLGGASVLWGHTRSLLIAMALFYTMFQFLPHTKVRIPYAIVPAVVAAVLFELTKMAFSLYMSVAFATNYSILYGALGLLPVILIWIYLTWTLTLLCVQASYCAQHFQRLMMRRLYEKKSGDQERWIFLGTYAPIEVVAALVRKLCGGDAPVSSDDLAATCQYPSQAVEAILDRLQMCRITRQVDSEFAKLYVLSRPLDATLVQEVMNAFDESTPRVAHFPNLNAFIQNLNSAQSAIWDGLDINVLREDALDPRHPSSTLPAITLSQNGKP